MEEWMKRLVPRGEYVIDIGEHPMVLKPTTLKEKDIPNGHHFYHFRINDEIYTGVFVGGF
ncbi:MAG: hypothetical protein J6K75_03580 [Erysipelotrichaceae bacterium]|nr:hypothetical protein [Erysipelotrichaceae bacterium]